MVTFDTPKGQGFSKPGDFQMRKLLAIILTGVFAVSASSAFAGAHAKGEKGDMKKDEKKK